MGPLSYSRTHACSLGRVGVAQVSPVEMDGTKGSSIETIYILSDRVKICDELGGEMGS